MTGKRTGHGSTERVVLRTVEKEGYPRTWPITSICPGEAGDRAKSEMTETPEMVNRPVCYFTGTTARLCHLGRRIVSGR